MSYLIREKYHFEYIIISVLFEFYSGAIQAQTLQEANQAIFELYNKQSTCEEERTTETKQYLRGRTEYYTSEPYIKDQKAEFCTGTHYCFSYIRKIEVSNQAKSI